MANSQERRRGTGLLWAGALASVFTATPVAPFRSDAHAQASAGLESVIATGHTPFQMVPGINQNTTAAELRGQGIHVWRQAGVADFAPTFEDAITPQKLDEAFRCFNLPPAVEAALRARIQGSGASGRDVQLTRGAHVDKMLSRSSATAPADCHTNVAFLPDSIVRSGTDGRGTWAPGEVDPSLRGMAFEEIVTEGNQRVLYRVTYFRVCNNPTVERIVLPPLPAPVRVEARVAPCINIRVRPPAGVDFSNANVRARVLVLDMNSGTTLPAEECPVDTGQVQVNCESDCTRVLREAADRSPGFTAVVQRVRRERGAGAAISRVFTADARITPATASEETYITVPVRSDKLNRNFVTIVCFDWENGGSSVDVIHNPGEADAAGFIRDRLIMQGTGANMDVFEGQRRVFRGADRTE